MFSKNNSVFTAFRRYHFAIAIAIILILLMLEAWFLFIYFYQPLLATQSLLDLKEYASLEELNRPVYEQIKKFSSQRKTIFTPGEQKLRDPFTP